MEHILHWLIHFLGIDTQQSDNYDFWSGVGPVLFGQIPILIALIVSAKHKNCFVKGCWRLGHMDPAHGHPACRRHHSQANMLELHAQRIREQEDERA